MSCRLSIFLRTFGLLQKVLSFENKNKLVFILYFAHLFVPLHPLFSCDGELSQEIYVKQLNLE